VDLRIGYGTYIAAERAAAPQFRVEVSEAEQAGFDGIYFSEHHGVPGYAATPLTLAAMALAQTTVLRAGPMPLLLPLHDPVRIAEESAMIDFLSQGRLVLGLGAGYHPSDYGQAGIPLSERAARMEEGIALLHNVWSAEPRLHDGPHYRLGTTNPLNHRPWTQAGPPVWLATGSRTGTERAARLGDGLVLGSTGSVDRIAEDARQFRAARERAGRDPGTLAVIRRAWIGPQAECDEFIATMQREYSRHSAMAGVTTGTRASRELQEQGVTRDAVLARVFVGDASAVRDQLHQFAESVGADYLMLKFQWATPDFATVREQLVRARDVLR
jgi:alkanesulfonate monooxygenase SsuD/methylene tetrahydromethanopterin reductase-like flavin-dependent oxidoreductase (luciferase family)